MPIPKLKFLNEVRGTPKKPVPLRYAILAADIEFGTMCALLTGELHYCDAEANGIAPLLTAYELTAGASARTVTPNAFRDICSHVSSTAMRKTQLKSIPKSFYVWSDDLANAYQHYISLVPGRENAHLWNLALNWNPALGSLRALIEECPNPESNGSQRATQAYEVEQRNRRIFAEFKRIKKEFPYLSKSDISTRIAKQGMFQRVSRRVPQSLTSEAIRRLLNRYL